MTPRITQAKIDTLTARLERVRSDIQSLTTGDVRAADSERIRQLRLARQQLAETIVVVKQASPTRKATL